MKKVKRTCIATILSLLLLGGAAIGLRAREGAVVAEEQKTVSIAMTTEAESVVKGQTFTVDLSLTENSGVVSLYLQFAYDTEKLQLVSATNGDVFTDPMFGEIKDFIAPGSGEAGNQTSDPYIMSWDESDKRENGVAVDVTKTGSLGSLTFRLLNNEKVVEEDSISISVTLGQGGCYDKDGAEVALNPAAEGSAHSVSVTVASYIRGDVNGDGVVTSDDAIHLLFHSLFPTDEDYTINQSGDMNGDGVVTSDDAIHLLFHSLFPTDEDYILH